MTSLFIWVLLVLVIPNLSPYLASFLAKTPSKIKTDREVYKITQVERDEVGRKLMREKILEMQKKYPVLAERLSDAEIQKRIAQDAGYKKAYEELREAIEQAWFEANQIQGAKAQVIEDELDRKEEAQEKLSQYVSMISPLSDFTYLATDLSSTGIRNMSHFSRISGVWEGAFRVYGTKKTASLKEKDATIDIWNSPVDVSDRPRFQYKQEALVERLKGTIRFFVILIIFSLALFSAAFISFIRYDVR